ncbi:MAG: hypothetical protein GY943_16765 [Chloroflexi bacterium]|nr:hypothetical protein [Chloroflexota bacterium]
MTTFFISDPHFGHENIIAFCERPFDSVAEMDAVMIAKWNDAVGADDTVFLLGDLCLGGIDQAKHYLSELNGRINVLPGNHDTRWFHTPVVDSLAPDGKPTSVLKSRSGHPVHRLPPIETLEFEQYGRDGYPRTMVLCHYPMWSWDKKFHGAWHLHGHAHNNPNPDGMKMPDLGLALNVSVEMVDYRPISIEEVAERLIHMEKVS